jgi:hypothetical protein
MPTTGRDEAGDDRENIFSALSVTVTARGKNGLESELRSCGLRKRKITAVENAAKRLFRYQEQ